MITIECIIAGLLISLILIVTFRTFILRKNKGSLMFGLLSIIAIIFGVYLRFKSELILSYSIKMDKIDLDYATLIGYLGLVLIYSGFLFVLLSIIRYLLFYLKRH